MVRPILRILQGSPTHIKSTCSVHIDQIMTTHGWHTLSPKDDPCTALPLRMDVLSRLPNHTDGPNKGTKAHVEPQDEQGFSHRMLLGEMMFAHVSCCPDTGCAITLMSKCAFNPSAFHHNCLQSEAKCLRTAEDWGMIHHRKGESPPGLPDLSAPTIP